MQQRSRSGRARLAIAVAAAVASAAVVTWFVTRPRPPARIILVVIDTLRRDRVSAYGGSVPTPNIDAFAAEGTVFRHATGAFHQTTMSMAALFTGRTPSLESATAGKALPWTGRTWCGLSRFAAGEGDACLPAAVPTLAEALRGAGYHTVGVASNLLMFRPAGYDRGFDEWREVGPTPEQVRSAQSGGAVVYDPRRQAGDLVNRAVRSWLESRTGDHFFLYVHYMDAHDWLQRKIPYDEGVRLADDYVGELRHMLDQAGLLRGSVVILTADHGEGLGEAHAVSAFPTHMGNPSFQPVLRVPLVVWPRIDADTERFLRSDDIHRLIRRIAGLDEGRPPDLASDELFLTEQFFRTYRHGRWKSLWPRGRDGALLFDLDADPDEKQDVAAAHPDEVAAHRRRVEELSRQLAGGTSSEGPTPEDIERLRALGYAE